MKSHNRQKARLRLIHLHANLLDHGRQTRLGTREAVLHIDLRHIRVGTRFKRNGKLAHTNSHGLGVHIHQAIKTVHLALNERIDCLVNRFGISTRVHAGDVNSRRSHQRILRHRQHRDRNKTCKNDENRNHPSKNRSVNKKLGHALTPPAYLLAGAEAAAAVEAAAEAAAEAAPPAPAAEAAPLALSAADEAAEADPTAALAAPAA